MSLNMSNTEVLTFSFFPLVSITVSQSGVRLDRTYLLLQSFSVGLRCNFEWFHVLIVFLCFSVSVSVFFFFLFPWNDNVKCVSC